MKKKLGGIGVLVAAMLLITAMTAGQAPAQPGNPTATAAKKCKKGFVHKKIHGKKKCVRKKSGGGSTTPTTPTTPAAPVATSLTASCDGCGVDAFGPVCTHNVTVTIRGVLAPDSGGSTIEVWNYTNLSTFNDFNMTTGPGGAYSFTYNPGAATGWNSSMTIQFHGDATRKSSLTTFSCFVN